MAEENQIIPAEAPRHDPDARIDAETLMAAGDALSKSMLFALRREDRSSMSSHPVHGEFVNPRINASALAVL